MKILDYAIVFVIIILPIILALNININSKIKAQNLESYYKNIIDSAISDASKAMKEVENADAEVDYGYSGDGEKKVSINAKHAVNIFFDSLFYNLDIKGNKQAEERLKMYVPAVAVVDYNGVHMYSVEKYKDSEGNSLVKHVMKPKKHFTYSYDIKVKFNDELGRTDYTIVNGKTHTVNFTLNNFITHIDEDGNTFRRFMEDPEMQDLLFDNAVENETGMVRIGLLNQLKQKQKEVIVQTVANEISTAINRHNKYADERGIRYTFTFPTMSEDDWFSTVQDIGILAFVQGISIGNKYLNHYSYGLSKLSYNQRYYPSTGAAGKNFFGSDELTVGYNNLYHKDKMCSLYQRTVPVNDPIYFKTQKEAASSGYSPCPVCFYDMIDYYFPQGLDHTKPINTEIVNGLPGGKYLNPGESKSFAYTGTTVEFGLEPGKYQVEVWGAQGGGSETRKEYTGGRGGYVKANLDVDNNMVLNITVGGKGKDGVDANNESAIVNGVKQYVDNKYVRGGFNGGGNASGIGGAGGGGASDIRIGGTSPKNRVIVAGGGGGSNFESGNSSKVAQRAGGGAITPKDYKKAQMDITIHRQNTMGNAIPGIGTGLDVNIIEKANPVEVYGESGCTQRHMKKYPNDESGGGGGYYGGAVFHGDDAYVSYGGTSYANPAVFKDITYEKGVRDGNGLVIIKRLK